MCPITTIRPMNNGMPAESVGLLPRHQLSTCAITPSDHVWLFSDAVAIHMYVEDLGILLHRDHALLSVSSVISLVTRQ